MDQLKEYFRLQREIYSYFGYKEQWRVVPFDDATDYYWSVDSDNQHIGFAESANDLLNKAAGEYYENVILKEIILRKEHYTLIYVDTHTDGNRFLMILDNSKEIKHGRI